MVNVSDMVKEGGMKSPSTFTSAVSMQWIKR